jgi:hypothetical protein
MPARRHCWGKRGAAGMLQCWWGSGGGLVVVKDDGGGGCAIALLGQWRLHWGMRAVMGMGQQEREVTINLLLGGTCDERGQGKVWRL